MTLLRNFPKIALQNSSVVLDSHAFASCNSLVYPKKSLLSYVNTGNSSGKLSNLVELIFFGLNYNAKRIRHFRRPWVLDLQKSHKIKVEETRLNTTKTKVFKRRVLFYSQDKSEVTSLVKLLKSFRKQNCYSGHGLISRNDNYKTKAGKIRQK